jgi:hypothetical protein
MPPEPAPQWSPPGVTITATEADMCGLLARRYTYVTFGCHRYAFAAHVLDRPVSPVRVADFIAVGCWASTDYAIHGHEVKVSRSDWLAELRDPEKAEAFKRYCHYWWLVVPDLSIVRGDVLPAGWGLLVRERGAERLRAQVQAPTLQPKPMPRRMSVALLRAVGAQARNDANRLSDAEPRPPQPSAEPQEEP